MDPSVEIPVSIWERILQEEDISARDVLSVCSTCKALREPLLYNNSVWWYKFGQRWNRLAIEVGKADNCFDLYVQRHGVVKATKKFLDCLSARFMRERSTYLSYSAYEEMEEFGNRCDYGSALLIDELRYILLDIPEYNTRLTHQYYAPEAVRFLVQQKLTSRWQQWLDGPQLLEAGAWLVVEWLVPTNFLDERCLTSELGTMAQDTLARVSEMNKRHPVLHCDPIDHEVLRETLWSPAQTREVVEALNFVFAVRHGYRGNVDDYYSIDNSLMNLVLSHKKGIPITLCILYHAVARRLGVYCALVNFPGHVLLKFVEHPGLSDSEKYTYIDVFNSCRLMREDQVWSTLGDPSLGRDRQYLNVATPVEVISRMLHNIAHISERYQAVDALKICSAWELNVILKPMEFDARFLLARIYSHLDINTEKILELMEGVPEPNNDVQRAQRRHLIEMARARMVTAAVYTSPETLPQPKLRSAHPHVKHSVGMIMRHKKYDYTCVIADWDPICAAGDGWKSQMGVSSLSRQDKQPFYHVLVNDGSNRYAAEENMVFEPNPSAVSHPEVGKYFQEYAGQFYKMNADLLRDYPDDEAATVAYVQSAYGNTGGQGNSV